MYDANFLDLDPMCATRRGRATGDTHHLPAICERAEDHPLRARAQQRDPATDGRREDLDRPEAHRRRQLARPRRPADGHGRGPLRGQRRPDDARGAEPLLMSGAVFPSVPRNQPNADNPGGVMARGRQAGRGMAPRSRALTSQSGCSIE